MVWSRYCKVEQKITGIFRRGHVEHIKVQRCKKLSSAKENQSQALWGWIEVQCVEFVHAVMGKEIKDI